MDAPAPMLGCDHELIHWGVNPDMAVYIYLAWTFVASIYIVNNDNFMLIRCIYMYDIIISVWQSTDNESKYLFCSETCWAQQGLINDA